MAKKKGRRSVNVARKREKRNRDRKFRQKKLAIEKQRKLPYEKSEEEHLHACISQSRALLDEPELEGVLFDFELMYTQVTKVLDNYDADEIGKEEPEENAIDLTNTVNEAVVTDEELNALPEAERTCEHFRLKVLPHLVTPEFMQQLRQSLTACETRLKVIGNRELAEVAYVTRSLFDAAPPDILSFHPMIQAIGIETLRILVEEPDMIIDRYEEVKEILSSVLEHEDSETYQSESIPAFSDAERNLELPKKADTEFVVTEAPPPHLKLINTEATDIEPVFSTPPDNTLPIPNPSEVTDILTPETPIPSISPDELPARALYKNFNGLEIIETFKEQTDNASLQEGLTNYALVNESDEQVEFVDVENERYITVTEERLQLHARSEAELTIAMAEVETQCTSAVMYLAKTIEERG